MRLSQLRESISVLGEETTCCGSIAVGNTALLKNKKTSGWMGTGSKGQKNVVKDDKDPVDFADTNGKGSVSAAGDKPTSDNYLPQFKK